MRVIVTGATGFLGEHLTRRLVERGHELVCLARATSDTRALEALGARVVRASFDEHAALARALEPADAIIHAAGGGMARNIEAIYRANTSSTEALVRAAPSHLSRFVLVSSLAAHGPSREGRPAREQDPDAPRSHYGRSKLLAEKAAGRLQRAEVVIVRPPALYGPGEHRMVELFRAAERGFVPMVHRAGTLSLLHGADCAKGIVLALEASAARGVYYLAEERVYSRRELAEGIGRAVGRSVRVVPVPVPALFTLGMLAEVAARLRDRPPSITRDKARDAGAPHQACDPSRAKRELAFATDHHFERGARDAYEDYRRRGWL